MENEDSQNSIDNETKYLLKIIKELEDKNALLVEELGLWKQKCRSLEERLTNTKNEKAGSSSYSNQVKKVNINTTAKQREASSASSEATVVTSRQTVSNTEIRSEVCNDEVATAPELEDIASEQQKEEFEGRFEFQRKQTRKQKYNHQKQRKSLEYGECNDEEFNLAGDNKDKKIWLFLSKVNETITANTISDYIVKHASTTANEIQKRNQTFFVSQSIGCSEMI
ncbi:unnamed protein product [Acanthoscelides obtectus]|uniref:Uncharacterized protein n=1 Tax=Acanthoscelides obtectus TaxID=200917 RepID=A0A9P0L818_ACAOB|nr:unnamed protein product [Acanthoscelides obtectus]CAK1638548.1 hypothetical protein AOBTE_LOCUS10659 [Acanthoscelides obtectus]